MTHDRRELIGWGRGSRVRILTYHRVGLPRGGDHEALTVRPRRFLWQLRALRLLGCRFVGLDRVADWLEGKAEVPRRAVVLTFDDGFADIYDHALPALSRQRVPAAVYLISRLQEDSWRRPEYPEPLKLLSPEQVQEMARRGIQFGSHTRSHARLVDLDADRLTHEVQGSRQDLEERLGREVRHFCYPYGDQDARVVEAVRAAGYRTASVTVRGTVSRETSPFLLPRLTVGKRMGIIRFLLRVLLRNRACASSR